MTNIIAAIIFIIISIGMISIGSNEFHYYYNNQNRSLYIKQEAAELTQYSNAVFNYITAYGLPLSESNLSVLNLKSVGLLPSTFPPTTPFGQTFTASYNTDSVNPNVEDVLIRTTGNFNSDLSAKVGLNGTLGYTFVASNVDSDINIPPYKNSTGTYIGFLESNIFTYAGQQINMSLSANNTEPGIYIKAPDQYGYWLINFSDAQYSYSYGYASPVGSNLYISANLGGYNIISQGWYNNCPLYASQVNSNVLYNSPLFQKAWYTYPFNENQGLYCIPAYKNEVSTFNINTNFQYFGLNSPAVTAENLTGNSSNNYNDGLGGTATRYLYPTTNYYINPSQINGYIRPLYGIEELVTGTWDGPLPMSNSAYFLPPSPVYSFVAESGFQLNLVNPAGQPVTYQIAIAEYSLTTGVGCYDSILSSEAGFPVYYGANNSTNNNPAASCSANGQNLNSMGNYAFGWAININPSNPNSYTFPAAGNSSFPEYEDAVNGNFYTVPLTVDTSTSY